MDISRSAFSSAVSTIQSGQRRVDQAAGDIASQTVPLAQPAQAAPTVEATTRAADNTRPDLAESLIALREGLQQVQAGSKVAKSADEVMGTLIDTHA